MGNTMVYAHCLPTHAVMHKDTAALETGGRKKMIFWWERNRVMSTDCSLGDSPGGMMTDDGIGCRYVRTVDQVTSLQPRRRNPLDRIATALEQLIQKPPFLIYEAGSVSVPALSLPSDSDRTDDPSHGCVKSCDPLLRGRPPVTGSSLGLAPDDLSQMKVELAEIKNMLKQQQKLIVPVEKKFYTVDEVAELTGHKSWTIRQACNKGRIKGKKGDDGRWRIAHEELTPLQEKGLPAE